MRSRGPRKLGFVDETYAVRGEWVRIGSVLGRVLAVDDEYDMVAIRPLQSLSIIFAPQTAVELVDFDGEFFVLTSDYWERADEPPSQQSLLAALSLFALYSAVSAILTIGRATIRKVFSPRG